VALVQRHDLLRRQEINAECLSLQKSAPSKRAREGRSELVKKEKKRRLSPPAEVQDRTALTDEDAQNQKGRSCRKKGKGLGKGDLRESACARRRSERAASNGRSETARRNLNNQREENRKERAAGKGEKGALGHIR